MDFDVQPIAATSGLSTSGVGGVITIGRKKYAVNLYWQPSPSGRVSQAARETARQPGQMADFYAVRPGNATGRVPQFALGQKEFGHRVGLPTGAASLAEDQPGSWAGVFKVAEGWWLVVSRDDLIAPDGDILFSEEEEARERLFEEINLGGLQRIYAPDQWGVRDADPMPLSLLMQGRADFRLQYVRYPVKALAIGGGALLAVIIVGYLALGWQQEQQNQFERGLGNLTPEQAAILRQQQQQQLVPPTPPPPPPKRVWEDKPRGYEFLLACRLALNTAPANMVGWSRGDVMCAGSTLSITWQRTKGPAVVPPRTQITKPTTSVTSTFDLPKLNQPRGSEQLAPNGTFYRRALEGNWPIEVADLPDDMQPAAPVVTPAIPGATATPPAPPPPPPWVKKKITVKSETAPWYIWSRFMDVPGLIVEKAVWQNGKWTTEGVLYESR